MFGDILNELRKDFNLSQKELAAELHVSPNTISTWETNKSTPDDTMKIKLAKMFNVSLDYMFELTDVRRPLVKTGMRILVLDNLPDSALKEITDFLGYIKTKYHIE